MGKLKESIKNLGKAVNGVEPNGYYITDIVKDLGKTFTGNEVNGVYLTDILDNMANNYNASKGFIELVPYMATDVLGKATTDLQDGVEVVNASIKGTLKYVTGYTGFSGDPAEQSGNFLTVYTPLKAGVTVTMELIGGTTGVKTLDDGIMVVRITNKDTQSLKLVATDGVNSVTRIFDFKELTLTPAPVPPPAELTPFAVGNYIAGFDFGNVNNGDTNADLDAFLTALGDEYTVLVEAYYDTANAITLAAYKGGLFYAGDLQSSAIPVYSLTAGTIEGMTFTRGYQNLVDGKATSGIENSYAVDTILDAEGWNGILVGAVAGEVPPTPPTPSLTPLGVGDTFVNGDKIYFDKTAAIDTFLTGLTYTEGQAVLAQGTATLSEGDPLDSVIVFAGNLGTAYIMGVSKNGDTPVIVYATEAIPNYCDAGWQNLGEDDSFTFDYADSMTTSIELTSVSAAEGWNGVIVGK